MALYLIHLKRQHTSHVRVRDEIIVVEAERNFPPFPKSVGLGMKNINRWHPHRIREINSEHSLRNMLRKVRRDTRDG